MARNAVLATTDQAARRQLVEQVGGMIVSLGAETQTLSSAGDQLGSLSATAEGQAQTVAAASEQTSQVIDTVASATQELSSSLHEVSRRTTETSDAVQRAVAEAAEAQSTMVPLDASCKAISKVSNMIASVARQTNLLALNATIEAARAGEAGKGFAVVANEIKELSRQTGEATKQIDRSIGALTSDAERVGRAITSIAEMVTRIGAMTIEVATAVEEQTLVTAEIAHNVTEAASSSVEMAHAISGVHSAITNTDDHVRRVHQLTGRLREEGAALNDALQCYLKGETPQTKVTGKSTGDRLRSAVAAHGAWKARLMEVVVTNATDLDATVVARDDRCPLGVWLYQESTAQERQSPHYEEIRALHARFHELASTIIQHAVGSQQAKAIEEIAFGGVFDALSTELVADINAWRDDLETQSAPRRAAVPAKQST